MFEFNKPYKDKKLDDNAIGYYNKKMIENLEKRGWGAYEVGDPGMRFTDENQIEECVNTYGRERSSLKKNILYTLFPLVENSFDWSSVRAAMLWCVSNGRYPFFVDLEGYTGDRDSHVEARGVYLVDSIIFNSDDNTWELVIDYILMQQLSIIPENTGNIILDIENTDTILKQLTKAKR